MFLRSGCLIILFGITTWWTMAKQAFWPSEVPDNDVWLRHKGLSNLLSKRQSSWYSCNCWIWWQSFWRSIFLARNIIVTRRSRLRCVNKMPLRDICNWHKHSIHWVPTDCWFLIRRKREDGHSCNIEGPERCFGSWKVDTHTHTQTEAGRGKSRTRTGLQR